MVFMICNMNDGCEESLIMRPRPSGDRASSTACGGGRFNRADLSITADHADSVSKIQAHSFQSLYSSGAIACITPADLPRSSLFALHEAVDKLGSTPKSLLETRPSTFSVLSFAE